MGCGDAKLRLITVPAGLLPSAKKRCGTLVVNVKSATNLRDADGFGLGKSDPYVVVTVPCGAKGEPHSEKTKHKDDDLNPKWNEEKKFEIDQPMDVKGTIIFEVLDSDMGGRADFLGKYDIEWPFWKGDSMSRRFKEVSAALQSDAKKKTGTPITGSID